MMSLWPTPIPTSAPFESSSLWKCHSWRGRQSWCNIKLRRYGRLCCEIRQQELKNLSRCTGRRHSQGQSQASATSNCEDIFSLAVRSCSTNLNICLNIQVDTILDAMSDMGIPPLKLLPSSTGELWIVIDLSIYTHQLHKHFTQVGISNLPWMRHFRRHCSYCCSPPYSSQDWG